MESMKRGRRRSQVVPDHGCGVVVAIDISKERIDYGAFRPGPRPKVRRLPQTRTGFEALESDLRELREQGLEVWVALEPTGHYGVCLQAWLRRRGWHVVQVNPYHVKRLREVRDNDPGSHDGKSPGVIADMVWDGKYYVPVLLEGAYAELRVCSREWGQLTREGTRLRNQYRAVLEVWFPELSRLFKDPLAKSVRGVVRHYKSPQHLAKSRRGSLERALRQATRGRGVHRAEAIREAARGSVAPEQGQVSRQAYLVTQLELLEQVERRREQLAGRMGLWLESCEETPSLRSVPGVGTVTAARLLGECGSFRHFPKAKALEKFVGLNLYAVDSGQHKGESHLAKRGRPEARAALGQAVLGQLRRGGIFAALAERMRAEKRGRDGKVRFGELRVAAARRLLELLFALVRDQQCFDRERFLTGARAGDGPVILQGVPQAA
jgi:transposase